MSVFYRVSVDRALLLWKSAAAWADSAGARVILEDYVWQKVGAI